MAEQRDLTYFISDLHLGSRVMDDPRSYERRVVRFLRSIAPRAKRLYMLGDVIDYWIEYRTVVPRGFTRFFGALAELADQGVEITWVIGNHDIWMTDYIPTEIGGRVVDGNLIEDIDGKRFFLSHGDGVGEIPRGFRFIRSMFRNRVCQALFRSIHPRWTVPMGYYFSSRSRGEITGPAESKGEEENYVKWARGYVVEHPEIDYILLGHRHILMDMEVSQDTRLLVLGDWIHHFSYAIWNGKELKLEKFKGGKE